MLWCLDLVYHQYILFYKGPPLGGRHIGIRFVCLSVRQHFGSDTITWVVFNVHLSFFIHRCEVKRSKVKDTTELCQHFGSDTITWVIFNVQLSYLYIDVGWWEEDTYTFWVKRSKVKVTTYFCQHFGSDTITWVVFNVQLSFFIHRCRMVREKYLNILGKKVEGQGHNWTLSTLWFRIMGGRYLYILGGKGQRSRSQLTFVNTLVLTR